MYKSWYNSSSHGCCRQQDYLGQWVKQPDSLEVKTVFESGCTCSHALMLVWQSMTRSQQSACWVAVVRNDAVCLPQTPPVNDVLSGQESVSKSHHTRSGLAALGRAVPVPGRDAATQQAFAGAPVAVCVVAVVLPYVFSLLRVFRFYHAVCLSCSREMFSGEVHTHTHTEELKAVILSPSASHPPLLSPVVHSPFFGFTDV